MTTVRQLMQITDEMRVVLQSESLYRFIFVFGSNLEGRHGKGAALYAKRHYGAIYGQGKGLQGDSYAIPTKGSPYDSLSLTEIQSHVQDFLNEAKSLPKHIFLVTPIGCGHAGHKIQGIAPMFKDVPPNVLLPAEFTRYLDGNPYKGWNAQLKSPIVDRPYEFDDMQHLWQM